MRWDVPHKDFVYYRVRALELYRDKSHISYCGSRRQNFATRVYSQDQTVLRYHGRQLEERGADHTSQNKHSRTSPNKPFKGLKDVFINGGKIHGKSNSRAIQLKMFPKT